MVIYFCLIPLVAGWGNTGNSIHLIPFSPISSPQHNHTLLSSISIPESQCSSPLPCNFFPFWCDMWVYPKLFTVHNSSICQECFLPVLDIISLLKGFYELAVCPMIIYIHCSTTVYFHSGISIPDVCFVSKSQLESGDPYLDRDEVIGLFSQLQLTLAMLRWCLYSCFSYCMS